MSDNEPWWGDFSLMEQQVMHWSIGERSIVIQRLAAEWSTWNVEVAEANIDNLVRGEWLRPELPDPAFLARHLQQTTAENIRVRPALADRPVVIRPNVPLQLLSGEQARLYISTPLWFTALTLPKEFVLLDVPFWRPSDSWFGPSTMEGEFCYAKYTDARLQLALLEQRPDRAITPICVANKSKEILLIERLNIPVPLLHLYANSNNQLWTEAITITRESDGEMAKLHLEKQPPAEAKKAILIEEPRMGTEKNTLIRTINSLFA